MKSALSVAVLCVAACFVGVACGAGAKQEVAETALTKMSPESRRTSFEATLRVLDENPELVDELYAVTRKHPVTMTRFTANTARDLREPELARITGELLAKNPESLEQTLVTTTDIIVHTEKKDPARKAMSSAMAARAEQMVDVLTDDPQATTKMVRASLAMLEKKPQAKSAMLTAVKNNREGIVAFVKSDPGLAKDMGEELVKEVLGIDKDEKAKKK